MTDLISDALAELNTEIIAAVGTRSGTIETPGTAKSAVSNELVPAWTTFGTVTVIGMNPTGGISHSTEMTAAEGVVGECTHLVTVTYLANVTAGMRINVNGRALYIGYVHDIGTRGETLQLYCGETLRG